MSKGIDMRRQPAITRDESRRRRREAVIIGVTAALIVVFAIVEAWLPSLGDSASQPTNVTFFLLINVNLILLILLVFLVGRNLAKLILERRRGTLGARLRARLVFAFTVLALLPAVSLFLIAQGFLSATIDNWFSSRVERAFEAAHDIAESFYRQAGDSALHYARALARQIEQQELLAAAREAELRAFAERKREELKVGAVEVFVGQEEVAAAVPLDLRPRIAPLAASDVKHALIDGGDFARTEPISGGDLIRAGTPIRGGDGKIHGAVVVSYVLPRPLSRSALRAVRQYREYRQAQILEQPIKNGYVLTFLLVTLIVIFSATWFGFHLAKGLSVPIQRLGEGMTEVARGNWSYRAEAGGDEELATLVNAFNQMAADLQRIHSALDERHRYIENVLANVAGGVISLDAAGAVVTVNPAAAQMLELEAGEAHGRSWREVFRAAHLQRLGEMLDEVIEGRAEKIERQTKIGAAGGEVSVWVTVTSLTNTDGSRAGVILFLEDVSHLLRAERMEAWREVARRIAHEIKNPLTPIQLSAQRLQKRYASMLASADRTLLDECTRTIIGQVDALKRLVNEFSTFARLPALEMAPHDLNALVDEALVLFREAHRDIDFRFAADRSLPEISIDRDAVKRAVINMLDNAVYACHSVPGERGRVEIRTEHDGPLGVVRLEVADNGIGMTPGVKARACEPYFSTKKDGSGLGLAIVSAIAADHHAYLRLRDNEPRGTCVAIEFPLRRAGTLRAAAHG